MQWWMQVYRWRAAGDDLSAPTKVALQFRVGPALSGQTVPRPERRLLRDLPQLLAPEMA
jgi:hypothetical protein